MSSGRKYEVKGINNKKIIAGVSQESWFLFGRVYGGGKKVKLKMLFH